MASGRFTSNFQEKFPIQPRRVRGGSVEPPSTRWVPELLDPPCFRPCLPLPRKRPWLNVLHLLIHPEQKGPGEAKVIRLVLVQDLIGPLERRLPIRGGALRAAVLNRLIQVRILVNNVVAFRRVRPTGVPDLILVRISR